MFRRRMLLLLLGLASLSLLPVATARETQVLRVPSDYEALADAVRSAPDGAVVEVERGDYEGNIVIDRPLTVISAAGHQATIRGRDDAPVILIEDTQDVTIAGLTVVGGEIGILVTRSRDILIRDNIVESSRLTGIKVRLGAANIIGNTVRNTQPPYGRGIHVTNTTQFPQSRIVGNEVIDNALSGIATNMTSMVFIQDNVVRRNGQRGIAVTEMSNAMVTDNIVDGNVESGIFVSDMSMADICGNLVMRTAISTDRIPASQGNGITIDFYAEAMLSNNVITENASHGISVLIGSIARLGPNAIQNNVGSPIQATHLSQLLAIPNLAC